MTEEGLVIDLTGPVAINLDEISDDLVEPGWHTVEIERAEAKLTSEKKLPQVFVMARITDEADPYHGRTLIWNSVLAGEGLRFTKRFFKAIGLPADLNYPTYQDLAEDLIGRACIAKASNRTYEGEIQVQVNNWKAVDYGLGELEF